MHFLRWWLLPTDEEDRRFKKWEHRIDRAAVWVVRVFSFAAMITAVKTAITKK